LENATRGSMEGREVVITFNTKGAVSLTINDFNNKTYNTFMDISALHKLYIYVVNTLENHLVFL